MHFLVNTFKKCSFQVTLIKENNKAVYLTIVDAAITGIGALCFMHLRKKLNFGQDQHVLLFVCNVYLAHGLNFVGKI